VVDIPAAWPVEEAPVVPVFPLPDLWLSPGTLLPLHIFEPRYRQMIEDSLDGPGRLIMATVVEGHDAEKTPPIYPMGGMGEIGRHEKLAGGRYNIWLAGLWRVRIEEVESDRLYRKARAERVYETSAPDDDTDDLRDRLQAAIGHLSRELPKEQRPPAEKLAEIPLGSLADYINVHLDVERSARQEIFATLDANARARRVLHMLDAQPDDE
jgi:Lon protease-like protein